MSIVGGLLLLGLSLVYSSQPTVTGESFMGVLGAALAGAGFVLVRHPYPMFPVRAMLGTLLLPMAVLWLVAGFSDIST